MVGLPGPPRRARPPIRLLVAATIAYNVIEAIVAITAGTIASSTALIGFGLDSVIEVSAAAAVAWQFSAADHSVREAREKTTLRIIPRQRLRFLRVVVVTRSRPPKAVSWIPNSRVTSATARLPFRTMRTAPSLNSWMDLLWLRFETLSPFSWFHP